MLRYVLVDVLARIIDVMDSRTCLESNCLGADESV